MCACVEKLQGLQPWFASDYLREIMKKLLTITILLLWAVTLSAQIDVPNSDDPIVLWVATFWEDNSQSAATQITPADTIKLEWKQPLEIDVRGLPITPPGTTVAELGIYTYEVDFSIDADTAYVSHILTSVDLGPGYYAVSICTILESQNSTEYGEPAYFQIVDESGLVVKRPVSIRVVK
jgi:hypothetical protein